jgi:hypothetical protein
VPPPHGLAETSATSVLTCSPVRSRIHRWPGVSARSYSARERSTRPPEPMPRRL